MKQPDAMNLNRLTTPELLSLHADVESELRTREVLRSANNPTGDLAEYLFREAFGWKLEGNSQAHYDAVDNNEIRYQIKGRRITHFNNSRQLSALRDMNGRHFHFLAAVLFNEDYSVMRAALIPHDVALAKSTHVERTNSRRFLLRDEIWNCDGVRDETPALQAVRF